MRSGEIAKLLSVDGSTIRRYTRDFSEFLSKQDSPTRSYTLQDYEVILTVRTLYKDGFNEKAIRLKLAEGFRISSEDTAAVGLLDNRVIPMTVAEQMVDASTVRAEVDNLKMERERLLEIIKSKDERIEELQERLIDLSRQLGQLEGLISSFDNHPHWPHKPR